MLQENGFEEDSYAYVACMAVDRESRRTGAATALLGAAERMAGKWQQNFVLLHTYADNFPGLRLYHRNGCALEHTTLASSALDLEACPFPLQHLGQMLWGRWPPVQVLCKA